MESVVQMGTDFKFSASESEVYFEKGFFLNIVCMLKVHSIENETVLKTSHTLTYIMEEMDICFLKKKKVCLFPAFSFLKVYVSLPYLVSFGFIYSESMISMLLMVKYSLVGFPKFKLVFGNAYLPHIL